jgi:hypothetical protein
MRMRSRRSGAGVANSRRGRLAGTESSTAGWDGDLKRSSASQSEGTMMNKILMVGAALAMSSGVALAQGYNSSSTTTTTTQAPVVTVAPPVNTTTRVDHSTSNQNGVLTEETKRSQVTVPATPPTVTSTTRTEKTTTTGTDN